MTSRPDRRLSLDEIINTAPEDGDYRIVRPLFCRDGFTVSVQASSGHYCQDSNGSRYGGENHPVLPYITVEVGYPSERPEPWPVWRQYNDGDSEVYAFVPVPIVRDLIERHGGEA